MTRSSTSDLGIRLVCAGSACTTDHSALTGSAPRGAGPTFGTPVTSGSGWFGSRPLGHRPSALCAGRFATVTADSRPSASRTRKVRDGKTARLLPRPPDAPPAGAVTTWLKRASRRARDRRVERSVCVGFPMECILPA